MTTLIECIPNFSEARRPEVIDQIAAAIQAVSEVKLLDRSSDLDHNRTVLTFAGSPAGVEEAAFRAIKTAAELIDLDAHTGEHPRIGATDVVPFVPLSGATMEECVAIAQRLGQRVAGELSLPVYLYEAAATRPERANLENIRKGQYEGLKKEIESDPNRKPDFGPSKLPKAGATVIGARNPLIAFNVYLTSDDVNIAKKIAKAVRHSSGGLRYVKGLGLLVDGRAQVSMNLTNFHETPIARVVEFIRREAQRYGVNIHHCELVGLIPQEALVDAAVWYTQLDQFDKAQILESRLFDSGPQTADGLSSTVHGLSTPQPASFLDELASALPAPGGGSAAAYAGAMGAALVAMVSGLTIGRKKYAEVEAEMQAVRVMAEKLRAEMTQAVDDDAASFEAVIGAFKLPKETDDQQKARTAAIQIATLNAANIPLHSAERSVKIMELAIKCAEHGNLNAISDALSGFAMSRASLTAAAYNVRINVHSLPDKSAGDEYLKELAELEKKADNLEANIRKVMKERGGI
ncbi:MAG TPA: glutamate formimidoyltransferase [Anaerolineales bacterium]|jgi:glutamate formiminotransferase/formiminotetrahydrofolate cyclodeaminase|nr:glutamate formimidoyltransferase [Anaerolineales bacterium]HQX16733.1 glutamate formimidoyltransferase [Anaerolineales bacterium]